MPLRTREYSRNWSEELSCDDCVSQREAAAVTQIRVATVQRASTVAILSRVCVARVLMASPVSITSTTATRIHGNEPTTIT